MVCCTPPPGPAAEDADLRDAQRRFESHVLRTSQQILERYRFVGRGSTRMMQGVHAAYVAELRVIVQLFVWQRSQLVDPLVIGVPAPRELIASLIGRMEESRQEYVTSEALTPTVGAMFLWWRDNCARHAPEHIEADVLVRGNVADAVVDELAQLVWSLRRLEKRMEQE